ncbi:(2Fe-2S)-binding protein [Azospirillum brasilense]|jgi:bacterioferritin-associated ferredoxin|uniref:(2Fe-2S)-binding protein n=1 Tax=Azospirillum brasilense TaxID=192 RepID=A0A0P0ECV0_AZOBR|nr:MULTISPECIES: (2Fe-2S)-binding protein [Azospirillum]ALJ35495.1 (2Fe-2S)-binding protein [Azospirillum brasilense]MDW7555646.1 (2Fe-2S)-binding protein [Azospirillum brasilense]MDW7595573.1 (2Fe-2S)-binding protein [Azospirillum brasilense]MDW7630578.1 (2Fe-2S)-binding protein [Azospirillum brasilense]MDX5954226.1 (2Fe-2S)-binding protein [Azospirillum brasilense]
MYVCICHALNDKQVTKALENGARTPASVFRHYERQVQCGKCVPMMREMAQSHCANQCHSCSTHTATPQPALLPEPANAESFPYGVAAE